MKDELRKAENGRERNQKNKKLSSYEMRKGQCVL